MEKVLVKERRKHTLNPSLGINYLWRQISLSPSFLNFKTFYDKILGGLLERCSCNLYKFEFIGGLDKGLL